MDSYSHFVAAQALFFEALEAKRGAWTVEHDVIQVIEMPGAGLESASSYCAFVGKYPEDEGGAWGVPFAYGATKSEALTKLAEYIKEPAKFEAFWDSLTKSFHDAILGREFLDTANDELKKSDPGAYAVAAVNANIQDSNASDAHLGPDGDLGIQGDPGPLGPRQHGYAIAIDPAIGPDRAVMATRDENCRWMVVEARGLAVDTADSPPGTGGDTTGDAGGAVACDGGSGD